MKKQNIIIIFLIVFISAILLIISKKKSENVNSAVINKNDSQISTIVKTIPPQVNEISEITQVSEIDRNTEDLINFTMRDLEQVRYEEALSDPARYAKMGHQHPLIYTQAKENFSTDDLIEMYSLFDQDKYKDDWRYVAQLIGFISNKGNEKSIDVLMNYLQRPDVWPTIDKKRDAFNVGMGKSLCLEWIGMIGGNHAEEILLKALTLEGAKEVAKEYSDFADIYFPGGSKDLVASIRGRAAMGLVYCQTPKAISAVEQLYKEVKELNQTNPKENAVLLSEMRSAIRFKLLIDDIGLEKRYELYGFTSKLFTLMQKYSDEL